MDEPRRCLRALFEAAIASSDPAQRVPHHLPERPKGRTIVVGAGKAAAFMARAFEDVWTDDLTGLVVTRYGHALPTTRIGVVEASHPVPDAAGKRLPGAFWSASKASRRTISSCASSRVGDDPCS